jgi:ElaB/YqjD/DUF883 family membrane-anchored ribosome-binding protein
MATQTENEQRSRSPKSGQQQSEPTREQIREDQDHFAQLQESYQSQAHQQADEVKRQLQQATETGREALGQYVRGVARGYQAFIPQSVIDPHQAVDFVFDFIVQTADLQRSVVHELVGAGRTNARATNRAAEDVSDNR